MKHMETEDHSMMINDPIANNINNVILIDPKCGSHYQCKAIKNLIC